MSQPTCTHVTDTNVTDKGKTVLLNSVRLFGLAAGVMASGQAMAAQPTNWSLGFQEAATPIMEQISSFNTFTLWVITVITLFVLGLIVAVVLKFEAKKNPTPSKVSHNTTIEVVWTVVPILILLVFAVPSFRLLYAQLEVPKADVTIKAIGYQWYWGYEYPDHEDVAFDAIMLREDEERAELAAARGQDIAEYPRLLAVDNEIVVPVNKIVHMQVTAEDVIHAFAMPAFGVKVDAIPGRLNETWFKATKEGLYYGQCSELCGRDHAFMPIAVRVVSQEVYDAWVASAGSDLEGAYKQMASSIKDENVKLAAK